jgi:hypothetical protein
VDLFPLHCLCSDQIHTGNQKTNEQPGLRFISYGGFFSHFHSSNGLFGPIIAPGTIRIMEKVVYLSRFSLKQISKKPNSSDYTNSDKPDVIQ